MTVPTIGFNPDIMSTALGAFTNNDDDNENNDAWGGALDFARGLTSPLFGNNQPWFGDSPNMADGGQNGSNRGPMEQLLGNVGQLFDLMMNPENLEALLNGQPINGQYPSFGGSEEREVQ